MFLYLGSVSWNWIYLEIKDIAVEKIPVLHYIFRLSLPDYNQETIVYTYNNIWVSPMHQAQC